MADFFNSLLEHFPAKWTPVRRQKMRQNKGLEHFADPLGSENALGRGPLATHPTPDNRVDQPKNGPR